MRALIFNSLVVKLFPEQVHAVFDQGFKYGVKVSTYRQGDDMRTAGCKAIQMSDQMVCNTCGVRWDMNDPEPPKCGKTEAPAAAVPEQTDNGKAPNRFYQAFKNDISLMKQQLEKQK